MWANSHAQADCVPEERAMLREHVPLMCASACVRA